MTQTFEALLFTLTGGVLAYCLRRLYFAFRNARLKRRLPMSEWYAAKSKNFHPETGEEIWYKSALRVLSQNGDRIRGEERTLVPQVLSAGDSSGRTWEFTAKVEQEKVTDKRIRGSYGNGPYQGIFLLDGQPDSGLLEGSWLGFTPNKKIENGEYIWAPIRPFELKFDVKDTGTREYETLLRLEGFEGEIPENARFAVAVKGSASRKRTDDIDPEQVLGVVLYTFVSMDEGNSVCEQWCGDQLAPILQNAPYAVIWHTAVEEDYRRCGIATRLIVAVMERAREDKASRLLIRPFPPDNEEFTRVVEGLGFQNVTDVQESCAKVHKLRETPVLW